VRTNTLYRLRTDGGCPTTTAVVLPWRPRSAPPSSGPGYSGAQSADVTTSSGAVELTEIDADERLGKKSKRCEKARMRRNSDDAVEQTLRSSFNSSSRSSELTQGHLAHPQAMVSYTRWCWRFPGVSC